MTVAYQDEWVTLHHGDARGLVPTLGTFDVAIVDPAYGETNLEWDRWCTGWPNLLVDVVPTMWCFGSVRMFIDRAAEFAAWKLAQDVVGRGDDPEGNELVWEKHNGSGSAADRFKRVHELAVQFYRGEWSALQHDVPTTPTATKRQMRRKQRPPQWGEIGEHRYTSDDGGPLLMRSVIYVRSEQGRAYHPTQKPLGIVEPLITYSCPPGGRVLDPFAGSATTLLAARNLGRRAVGIEARADYVEAAVRRLGHATFDLQETGA